MSVLCRAPLRVSLGGGATDLPSYYRQHGGFCVAGAIDKYVYMLAKLSFDGYYRITYSQHEQVRDPSEIQNPLLRETLLRYPGPPVEIHVLGDVPAGTGLGSSGAFTVCLIKTMREIRRLGPLTASGIADEASLIEIDILQRPVGKQDQYASALGGITELTFKQTGQVVIRRIALDTLTRASMRERLLLYFTGLTREAGEVLEDQNERTLAADEEMLANLHRAKQLGEQILPVVVEGDLDAYGELLHQHWLNKHRRSPRVSNGGIDQIYTYARKHGVIGGKLCGAGGGGYLLLCTKNPERTRRAMSEAKIAELRFDFTDEGVGKIQL